jgi:hypothetical protein
MALNEEQDPAPLVCWQPEIKRASLELKEQ